MDLIVVLVYTAVVGGDVQLMAVQQPDMDTCIERMGAMLTIDRVPGEKIGDQQTWYEVKDANAKCVKMSVSELETFGDPKT